MQPFSTLTGRVVVVPADNIDTDQIIPARFLKTTGRAGLGENLFADWRYDASGTPRPDFPLNQPAAQGASILLVGANFGCGSSREHAPWALLDYGLRVVISTSFADIFRNNSLKNALLPVIVDKETHHQLFSLASEDNALELTIDLVAQVLRLPDGRAVSFPIDQFNRTCLLEGVDELGYLLKHADAISEFEGCHPPRVSTLA